MVPLQAAFVAEDVNNIIKESIDSVLLNQGYEHQKVRLSLGTSLEPQPRQGSVWALFCAPPPRFSAGVTRACPSMRVMAGHLRAPSSTAHPPPRARDGERMAVVVGGQVGQWTSQVVESCMKRLTGLNKPFKYVGEYPLPNLEPNTYLYRALSPRNAADEVGLYDGLVLSRPTSESNPEESSKLLRRASSLDRFGVFGPWTVEAHSLATPTPSNPPRRRTTSHPRRIS